jgi:hypothetical protein
VDFVFFSFLFFFIIERILMGPCFILLVNVIIMDAAARVRARSPCYVRMVHPHLNHLPRSPIPSISDLNHLTIIHRRRPNQTNHIHNPNQETLLTGGAGPKGPEAWHELLKFLNLYSQDVLSRKVC